MRGGIVVCSIVRTPRVEVDLSCNKIGGKESYTKHSDKSTCTRRISRIVDL